MGPIEYINPATKKKLNIGDRGLYNDHGDFFPLLNGVYRFVQNDNYTASFGFQWNRFERTQIDRFQKSSKQSYERFMAATGWAGQDLCDMNVLEVGSGAGRFTQILLEHFRANIYSVDYSSAVEANYRNNGGHERLKLFQASIYDLPFAPNQFDKVICFGVLQHTPDFRKSVACLAKMVKPGGELIVDFYPVKGWYTKIHGKYLYRIFTRRMSHQKLLSLIEQNAGRLISAYRFFDKLGVGKVINRFLPVCDIRGTLPEHLNDDQLREWVILDTFDMFSPAYDNPQPLHRVIQWFREGKMRNVTGSAISYSSANTVTVVKGVK